MSLKIMVADQEPRTVQLMRALATPLGHTVLHFGDYKTAGERGEAQPFDVAFVGMQPPESGGLELAHRIRQSQPNHGTPIVMLSSTTDIPSLRKAFGEGADLVLTKPLQADHLSRMLAAMDSPDWKHKRAAARLPLFSEVTCTWDNQQLILHSLNISESGMLLQPSLNVAIGTEVSVAFKIAEVRASLNLHARVIRKEGHERIAVEFMELAPEDRNAIEVYVTGHLTEIKDRHDMSDFGPRRVFRP
jgi:CheY-like chemotaxis protein